MPPETSLPAFPETPFMPTFQNTKDIVTLQSPSNRSESNNRTLDEAAKDATDYFAQIREPYALLLLNVLYRRFGVADFANSTQSYDQILAENPENAPLLRIFRRIADYNNSLQPEDFYAVTADVDKITVPALYSDRGILPETYMMGLINAAKSGGYLLTHVLLATIWLQDNHCDPGYDFRDAIYHATAGIINDDSVVTDLELEAAAFLCTAGQGALVDGTFVQRVIESQNFDGGWSYSNDNLESSNWHTSVLGLILLLHVEFPAASYPPMIATASSYSGVSLDRPVLSVAG